MKTCTKCKKAKSASKFYAKASGTRATCKDCDRASAVDWGKKNPKRKNAANDRWRQKHPDRVRHNTLQYYYGSSIEEEKRLLKLQKGKCAICLDVMRRPCMDHCHTTKKVRGLLCSRCNCMLGNSREDLKILRRGIKYLETHLTKNKTERTTHVQNIIQHR